MAKYTLEQRKQKKAEIKGLITLYGSPYRAAQALKVSASSFYERMDRVGIPHPMRRVQEPNSNPASWWQKLLTELGSVRRVAKKVGCSVWTVEERIKRYGLQARGNRGVEPRTLKTRDQRVVWLRGLLAKHKTGYKVSQVLGCSASAVYERMGRYGLKEDKDWSEKKVA